MFKGKLGQLLGMLGIVLGVLAAVYARGRKDQHQRHKKVEQKRYEETKEEINKIKLKNRDKTAEEAMSNIKNKLEKLKKG